MAKNKMADAPQINRSIAAAPKAAPEGPTEEAVNNKASLSFDETLNRQEVWFLKYRNQILSVVAAVILIVAGVVVYKNFISAPREDKASTALAKAQEVFGQGDFKTALNGSKNMEGFLAVSENYGGTDAANLADAYAGLCYAQLGDWNNAVKYLEEFDAKDDAMISPAVQAALGNAYANTGNIDKAVSTLKDAADMADERSEEGVNNALSPTYLIQAARLLESQGKKEEALNIYKEVKTKYVNSQASMDIDKYIERDEE